MSFAVVWHPPATHDLLDIKWQDAAWIVREVNKLAEDGPRGKDAQGCSFSPFASISTNCAMRRARVSAFFAWCTRKRTA